jgi:hypothetical protein
MKTIFTLLSSLIISMAVIAAPGIDKDSKFKSMLTIRSADRGDIRVVIDGRRFEPNRNFMRLQSLQPGYHRIKIYRERNNGFFDIFGRRYEVVFNGSVHVKPRTSVLIAVDRFGRTTIQEHRLNTIYSRNKRRYNDRDDRGYNDRDSRDWNDRDYNDRDARDRDNRDYRQDNDLDRDNGEWNKDNDFDFDRDGKQGDYDNGRDNRDFKDNGYRNTMNDFDFSNVLRSMEKEWFENNRTKSASQIISTNYFTAAQVKQLLQLFTFENNKLDLAKQAYGKTVDPKNYFMINDVFSFSSSKDELARYIRSYR